MILPDLLVREPGRRRRGDQRTVDLVGIRTQLRSPHPVDVDVHGRVVNGFVDLHVTQVGDLLELGYYAVGILFIEFLGLSAETDLYRRRRALAEDLVGKLYRFEGDF